MDETGKELSEKDLHCIARLLQSTVFAGDLFFGCNFCMYQCFGESGVPAKNYSAVMEKLQGITGVDMNPLCSGENALFKQDIRKFLKASNPEIRARITSMLGSE